jgi:hypothetical protein
MIYQNKFNLIIVRAILYSSFTTMYVWMGGSMLPMPIHEDVEPFSSLLTSSSHQEGSWRGMEQAAPVW